jgi:hypothetical protein
VNPQPVNFSAKLGPCIQCSLNTAPVVPRAPIFNQRLRFRAGHALRPVSHRLFVGPTSIAESLLEILQRLAWYMNPVATLGDIPAVSEALHQLCPGIGDAGQTPSLKGVMSGVAGGSTIWEVLPAVAWTLIGERPAAKSPEPPDAAARRMKFRREPTGLVAPLARSAESRFINRLQATCCSFRRLLRMAPSCFWASPRLSSGSPIGCQGNQQDLAHLGLF